MKYLVALLLLMHGLIHLMGFVKAFELAEVAQLSQAISRPAGVAWLLTGLAFGLAGVLYLLGQPNWWLAATPALLLSQGLILLSWRDARFGTIANLLILLLLIGVLAQWRFDAGVAQTRSAMLPARTTERIVTDTDIQRLPAPVASWLKRAGVVGKAAVNDLQLWQRGSLRTSPKGAWMPVTAEQLFRVEPPAFSWRAEVQMGPLTLLGHDQYLRGHGRMLIKVQGLLPLADSSGAATDQGSLLRYLAEIVWFPSAALSPYLRWEALDAHSARATISQGGISASAEFYFSPAGDFEHLTARRYYDRKTGPTLENWLVEADPDSYRDFEGIRVPAKTQVSWQLAEGDFNWFRLTVDAIHYNRLSRDASGPGSDANTGRLDLAGIGRSVADH